MRAEDLRPIFVVGYMHSGTTLLLNVLNNHPDIFCPRHETKYFMHLDLVRRHIAPSTGSPVVAAEAFVRRVLAEGFPLRPESSSKRRPLSDADAALAFRRAMEASAYSHGHARWAEKTPGHIYHAERISTLIPEAIFLEILRDPRDVLASKKTRKETVWTTERYTEEIRYRKHLQKSFDPLWDSLAWTSAVRTGARARRRLGARWLRVRYEDMVGQPESVVRRICEFAGLVYTPRLLEVPRGIPADPTELSSDSDGIVSASVGRWKSVLEPAESYICERVCRGQMLALGYPPETSSQLGGAAATLLGRSLPDFAVRLFHRWKLGGTAYLGAVLRSYAARLRRLTRSRGGG